MSFIYWENPKDICLENYTLIVPAVSVGNIGQLAVDLLLNNLKVKSIAHLNHSCFLPIAGADPYNPASKLLATSCQMYECREKKLMIIQHRAPLVRCKVNEYINFLVDFIKEHKIKNTIMLSSSFSEYFTFDQLSSVPLHYLCTQSLEEEQLVQELGFKKFCLTCSDTTSIPGGGISKLFLEKCETENVPLMLLIMVCSEGDNYSEADQMVSNLNRWLKLKDDSENVQWKKPFSWNYPYANDAPRVIY